jgi:hypothetical protein
MGEPLGTVTGVVDIVGGIPESHATLSFRQIGECNGDDIEIKSLNVAQGGTYSVDLPEGTYYLTASAVDRVTQVHNNITVNTGDTTTQDITIPD